MSQFVRPMQVHDVEAAVKVHLASFQGFFLTFLGPRFLRELYTGILRDTSGIVLVYVDAKGLQGFVAGTDEPKGLYSRLLRQRWWRFGLASVSAMLRRPNIVSRLFRAFRKPSETMTVDHAGLLMSVAVDPQAQGLHIGSQLVDAFLSVCRGRNLEAVFLTTDRDNNERINAFYLHRGFSIVRSYVTPEGRWMNEYAIQLVNQTSHVEVS